MTQSLVERDLSVAALTMSNLGTGRLVGCICEVDGSRILLGSSTRGTGAGGGTSLQSGILPDETGAGRVGFRILGSDADVDGLGLLLLARSLLRRSMERDRERRLGLLAGDGVRRVLGRFLSGVLALTTEDGTSDFFDVDADRFTGSTASVSLLLVFTVGTMTSGTSIWTGWLGPAVSTVDVPSPASLSNMGISA